MGVFLLLVMFFFAWANCTAAEVTAREQFYRFQPAGLLYWNDDRGVIQVRTGSRSCDFTTATFKVKIDEYGIVRDVDTKASKKNGGQDKSLITVDLIKTFLRAMLFQPLEVAKSPSPVTIFVTVSCLPP